MRSTLLRASLSSEKVPPPLASLFPCFLHYLHGLIIELSTETDLLTISNLETKSSIISSPFIHQGKPLGICCNYAVMRNHSKSIVVLRDDLDPSSLSSLA